MSRTMTQLSATHHILATERTEPYLQVAVYPGGIKVHMRSERMRAHGFCLVSDEEARALIAALQDARNRLAAMPPSAGTQALADLDTMLHHDTNTNGNASPTAAR